MSTAPAANRKIESPEATEAPPPVLPERPRFALSGIASSQRDGKATLTAILTDNGTLLFATVGEKLAGGYTVTGITESTMVIADPSGAEQTLTLGPARRP
jgi:type II secretory pathway component PulC